MSRKQLEFFGLLFLLHDFKDIGKFDRLHHWMLGAVMLLWPE